MSDCLALILLLFNQIKNVYPLIHYNTLINLHIKLCMYACVYVICPQSLELRRKSCLRIFMIIIGQLAKWPAWLPRPGGWARLLADHCAQGFMRTVAYTPSLPPWQWQCQELNARMNVHACACPPCVCVCVCK